MLVAPSQIITKSWASIAHKTILESWWIAEKSKIKNGFFAFLDSPNLGRGRVKISDRYLK